jgi:hypothetical protein
MQRGRTARTGLPQQDDAGWWGVNLSRVDFFISWEKCQGFCMRARLLLRYEKR